MQHDAHSYRADLESLLHEILGWEPINILRYLLLLRENGLTPKIAKQIYVTKSLIQLHANLLLLFKV